MKGKIKKIISGIVLAVVLLVVLGIIAFLAFTGTTIKHTIQVVGTTVTGCNITVENIDASLLKGEITIDNLVVANPDGYKSDYAFSLEKIHLAIEPKSLLSQKIHVRDIEIIEPHVTYELGLLESNIGKILENVNRFSGDGSGDKKASVPAETKTAGSGKSLQVDHVLFKGGQVKMTAKLLGGHGVPVPLPRVEMNDLGKDEEITIIPLTAKILKSMLLGVISVAK